MLSTKSNRVNETLSLNSHLQRLSTLIDQNRIREYVNPSASPVKIARPQSSPQKRRTRPQTTSRRLLHTSQLSRPSTATSKPSFGTGLRRNNNNTTDSRRRRTASISFRRSSSKKTRVYGTTSLRPNTERPQSPVGQNVLHNRKEGSPIHYSFLVKKQDTMLQMSSQLQYNNQQLSPSAKMELSSATTDLQQLRVIVENSKKVLLDRIDALLYNTDPPPTTRRTQGERSPYRLKL